jgi:hypothetical protein
MSTVDTREPLMYMPRGLLSMATQWVPVNRSTTSGRGGGGGGAPLPGCSSGMSTPWPWPTSTSRPGAKTYLSRPTHTVNGEAGKADVSDRITAALRNRSDRPGHALMH